MPPSKRNHDQMDEITPSSLFLNMFEEFKKELDEHHDQRERLIKQSRDITSASKKIIFSLQRVKGLKEEIPPNIAAEVQSRHQTIQDLFQSMSKDMQGINAWRYQRQVSPGLQEYVEAVSFEHYLRTQSLISLEQASRSISGGIELTRDDYVLGIFDLVGELMRFSITIMATTGFLPKSILTGSRNEQTVLTDLRHMRTYFEALNTKSDGSISLGKEVEKKMEVMKSCVEKVEIAAYGMTVRGRERPKGWVPDLSDDKAPVESF